MVATGPVMALALGVVVATPVVMAGAVKLPSGGRVVESAAGVETTARSVDSAGVMVAAVLIAGRVVSKAEAEVASSVEADVSDTGEAESNLEIKSSGTGRDGT